MPLRTYRDEMILGTALPIVAAGLHVAWNLVVKAGDDKLLAGWGVTLWGALFALPLLLVTGPPAAEAMPYLVVSSAIHVGYMLALIAAYDHGDLSVVYPIARGAAPLLTALGGAIWFEEQPSAAGVIGICLVSIGLMSTARGSLTRGVGWALATSATIVAYTLVDAAGVRASDDSVRYVCALFIGHCALLSIVVLMRRPVSAIRHSLRSSARSFALGGLGSIGAYGLVLTAIRYAPVAYVAALRESSVIIGALAGWLMLGEEFGPARTAAAVVTAGGMALILLG
jgi:drug/metabolite transporter (DMT)-like permease